MALAQSDSLRWVNDSIRFVKENTFYTLPVTPYDVKSIDTSLHNIETFYDIQQPRWEYFDHGYFGSPHVSIQHTNNWRPGFNMGLNNYDLYLYSLDDVRDYFVNRPYTEFRFLVGQHREQVFEGIHTQNISKTLNVGIHFKRRSTKGKYERNESLITNLDFYTRYLSTNGRFELRTDLVFNRVKQQESGGFAVDYFDSAFSFALPGLVPVNLDNAGHDWTDVNFQVGTEVNLGRIQVVQRDSSELKQVEKAMALFYNIGMGSYKRRFYDDNDRADEVDFYGSFYQDLDTILYRLRAVTIYQEAGFKFYTNPFVRNILTQQKSAVISIKARHENWEMSQYGFEKTYNNLSVVASISDSRREETPGIQYEAEGGFFLSGFNQKDYFVKGTVGYYHEKWGRAKGWASYSNSEPSWIQRYYISPSLNWKNDFNKEGRIEVGFSYDLPQHYLSTGFKLNRISNYVYFDTLGVAQQHNSSINMATVWLEKQFHIGIFHMEYFASLQFNDNNNLMPVPLLQLKGSWWVQGMVFNKALESRLGIDLRYNTNFAGYRFNPLTAQHFLGQRDQFFVPTIDVFLNLKVKTVRFVLKMQNVTEGLFRKGAYGVYPYPLYDRRFTAGFYWRFLD